MTESKALTLLEQFKGQESKYIVLAPTTTVEQISPFHRLRVSEVKISAAPADGDVYEEKNAGSGRYALHARALDKISQAAGIMWHPTLCGPQEVRRDYVRYRAVGLIRDASGQWRILPVGTKEIWAEDEEAEFRRSNAASRLAGQALENYVAKQVTYANQHRLAKAETKAKNRVIRAALAIKSTYSAAELQKPFVVPHIDFSPDYSDPQIKQVMLLAAARAQADLWGGQVAAMPSVPAIPIGEGEAALAQITAGAGANRAPQTFADVPADLPADAAEAPAEDDGDGSGTDIGDDGQLRFAGYNDGDELIYCEDPECGKVVEQVGDKAPKAIRAFSKQHFGMALCLDCQQKRRKAAKAGGQA